jgi:hypothetical protein
VSPRRRTENARRAESRIGSPVKVSINGASILGAAADSVAIQLVVFYRRMRRNTAIAYCALRGLFKVPTTAGWKSAHASA